MAEQPKCETCRFFSPEPNPDRSTWGDCRRHAPIVYVAKPGANPGLMAFTKSRWPHVSTGDFCGEHQPTAEAIQAAKDERDRLLDEHFPYLFGGKREPMSGTDA